MLTTNNYVQYTCCNTGQQYVVSNVCPSTLTPSSGNMDTFISNSAIIHLSLLSDSQLNELQSKISHQLTIRKEEQRYKEEEDRRQEEEQKRMILPLFGII